LDAIFTYNKINQQIENHKGGPMNQQPEKALLNLEEFFSYLGIGKTKARELLKDPSSTFTIKIGNRYYANKKLLNQWLDRNSGN
jgi:hypothetical protein